ncbi:putative nucleotide pyrophosphatase (putative) [Companilactobacillus mindensis DSM 14500]|uniref:Putative nucleotide pyrophosphatase (Putative) n=1 Tax=Companilactobacillus mindensis DSM 14500 TaxID=1423770 RepID=A0A0R1QM21_9LACO|nr:ectonucleotide pyrophosphatase/phosphodiesterase [Companilactobacillus mindensis]KRL43189.1 putative nucleotide pyrophosphatase (putative) [Companilactobacillus mindensis DSM 14500]GEO78169.1 alkaline phosphatase family protein [Companilactobacillus mindensis]
MSTNQHLVIISLDSLGFRDINEHRSELPTLNKLVNGGTWVKEVKGIYPTLTYPSHTTIITGQYPNVHGIVNNTKIQTQRRSPDWFWYQKDVKVPTLYDLARKQNLKTAAFLWPVTAGSKINYNLAEIFPNRIWTNQVLVSLKASSPLFILEMNQKYGKLRNGIHQPQLDEFITTCAVDTIKNKKPNLTLLHLVDMDSMRHRYGVRSDEAMEALHRLDNHVAKVIAATKAAGTFEDTNFVILGDHYQINVDKMIHLNTLFAKRGWVTPRPDQTFKNDWRVMAKTCDGCTYIYTRNFDQLERLRDLLSGVEGIERIYSQQEAIARGADPECTLMVEAKAGYYFTDESERAQVVEKVMPEMMGDADRYQGVHGYAPDKPGYKTTLIFNGPMVKENQTIDQANLVDEAPTFAKLLGLKFPEPLAGTVLEDVFRD